MAISAGMALMSTASAAITAGGIGAMTFTLGSMALTGFSALAAQFLVTTALGAAINALTPKPTATPTGYNVTATGSALDHQIIYGRARVGGVRIFDTTTGSSNTYLHRVVAFSGHEVQSFDEIYINDELVTLDGNGNVTNPSRYDGFVRIKKHLGSPTQAADSDLVSEVTEWTSAHKLSGLSYLYIRLKYDQDVFPNGVPEVTATIKGKKVYDPRTATTAWSDNPALCVRDYLISDYGLNEDAANIDDTLFGAAADVCDATVGSAARYTCNGNFTTGATPYDSLQYLLASMGGLLWYAQGKWRVKPAYWTEPVLTLTEDDLRGPISVSTRHSRRDNFNTVNGTFRGEESNWQITDFPPVTNSAFLDADNGQESSVDLKLSFTDNSVEARRLARITLERNRQQLTIQSSFGLRAFQVQVGDNVRISNARFGWVQKTFEVTSWTFGITGDYDLQVQMVLREISESVFDEVDDGIIYERDNTNILSPFTVPQPSLDAPIFNTKVNDDGTTIPYIDFSWSVTNSSLVEYYDFQWKLTSEPVWNSLNLIDTKFTLSPALSGSAYNYRVRAVNQLGVKSPFTNGASTVSTGADDTIPKAPTSVTAVAGSESIKVYWTAPTQNTDDSEIKDLFRYKVYRNTVNNSSTASLVGNLAADVFTDGSLDGGQIYYYWVSAVDYTGNEGAKSSVASATAQEIITTRSNGVFYIGVETLPTTSSGANTYFVSAIGTPVDNDQAWFYTGTLSSPTAQSVWIYREGSGPDQASSWTHQTEVIDGDLLVAGTITADKLVANTISALGLTIGTLSSSPSGARMVLKDDTISVYDANNVLRVKIGNLA